MPVFHECLLLKSLRESPFSSFYYVNIENLAMTDNRYVCSNNLSCNSRLSNEIRRVNLKVIFFKEIFISNVGYCLLARTVEQLFYKLFVSLKHLFSQEIALISEEAIRTATIICRERVEVLVVNRETILQYCPDVFQREYDEKVQVMK